MCIYIYIYVYLTFVYVRVARHAREQTCSNCAIARPARAATCASTQVYLKLKLSSLLTLAHRKKEGPKVIYV